MRQDRFQLTAGSYVAKVNGDRFGAYGVHTARFDSFSGKLICHKPDTGAR